MAWFLSAPSIWMVSIVTLIATSAQELPEELSENDVCAYEKAIHLPNAGKCLVPVSTAYDWTVAMSKCEQAKGKLYTLPPGNLAARPTLLRCLESIPDDKFNDMWINGVSLWRPHFRWINGSDLSTIQYCPSARPPVPFGENITNSISVDYCVSRCQARGYAYTVLQTNRETMTCYCVSSLPGQYRRVCNSPHLDFQNTAYAYVAATNQGSLIDVNGGATFSTSDILCSLIDNTTAIDAHLRSDSCFSRRPFICDLGLAKVCGRIPSTCTTRACNFLAAGRCLQRVNRLESWYSATDYCRARGGDLWVRRSAGDIQDVSKELDSATMFWIGATNYNWDFDATSGKLTLMEDLRTARCAHVYHKRGPEGEVSPFMEWSDTPCDQGKSFLCEFALTKFRREDIGLDVQCPWELNPLPSSAPGVTQTVLIEEEDDSFPWRALLAGIVASLMLLAALALLSHLCCGRRFRKPKDRVAFVPYFAGDTSQLEFETMSNADHHMRNNLRSASEHGSQTGLMKGGFSSSQADFSSKSLDRRHLDAIDKKFAESQQYLANNSMTMEEKNYSSSYQTMPSGGNEYMTLQANMTIQDEAELAAMRRSLRGKPEVTLVTDHMDMNFTVNHAHGSSPRGSEYSRSMDELHHLSPPASAYDQRNRSFADLALHDL